MITLFYSYLTNFVTYHYVELKEGIHGQISQYCFSYWVPIAIYLNVIWSLENEIEGKY